MEHLTSLYYFNLDSFAKNHDYNKEIIHNGKTYYYCTFPGCGKTFQFKSEAVRHRLIHIPQRPFECSFPSCRKSFKREDALKVHLRIHTGEKPYECKEPGCGQSFSNKSSLKYHTIKHKGEKEYKCDYPGCHKTFFTPFQLKQHERAQSCHQSKPAFSNSPFSRSEGSGDSPVKIRKYETIPAELAISGMEKFDWVAKTQDFNLREGKVDNDREGKYERMVKTILKENDTLKKKIAVYCNMLKGPMQENKDWETQFKPNLDFGEQKLTYPGFLDESIYEFLKFDN